MHDLVFDGSELGPPLGYYTYTVADGSWVWSDGMYALHGYAPGEVPATTAALMSHKHPDDRARTYEVFETAIENAEPYSCYHRVIDRLQRIRSVLAVGRPVTDGGGKLVQVSGFFVDLSEVRRSETQADVDEALARIAATRSIIDQAKGMVMLATGCDADTAFALLSEHSQRGNVKLRELAQRMAEAVGTDVQVSEHTRCALERFLGAPLPQQAS